MVLMRWSVALLRLKSFVAANTLAYQEHSYITEKIKCNEYWLRFLEVDDCRIKVMQYVWNSGRVKTALSTLAP
jgi:hypothetical protein